jgi:hypothetical protein
VMTAAAAAVPDGAQLPEGYTLPDYEAPIDAEAKLWKLLGDHLQVSSNLQLVVGVLGNVHTTQPLPGLFVLFVSCFLHQAARGSGCHCCGYIMPLAATG